MGPAGVHSPQRSPCCLMPDAPSPLWRPLVPPSLCGSLLCPLPTVGASCTLSPLWVWWNWRGRITIKAFAKAISKLAPLTLSCMVWHVVGDVLFLTGAHRPPPNPCCGYLSEVIR